ncbi:MAG TPA: hypothetical protein PLZ50_08940, partial [Rubrivivax sp.]|nr:hypothetical protein [Rubrivivax sp.]
MTGALQVDVHLAHRQAVGRRVRLSVREREARHARRCERRDEVLGERRGPAAPRWARGQAIERAIGGAVGRAIGSPVGRATRRRTERQRHPAHRMHVLRPDALGQRVAVVPGHHACSQVLRALVSHDALIVPGAPRRPAREMAPRSQVDPPARTPSGARAVSRGLRRRLGCGSEVAR